MNNSIKIYILLFFSLVSQLSFSTIMSESTGEVTGSLDVTNSSADYTFNISGATSIKITIDLEISDIVSGAYGTAYVYIPVFGNNSTNSSFYESFEDSINASGAVSFSHTVYAPNDCGVSLYFGGEACYGAEYTITYAGLNQGQGISSSQWLYSSNHHQFFLAKNWGDEQNPVFNENESFIFYDNGYKRNLEFANDAKLKTDYKGLAIESERSVEIILDNNDDQNYKVFDIKSGSTNNEPVFRVFEEGRVGIGVLNPTQRLHVDGNLILDATDQQYSSVRIGHDKHDIIMADNNGYTGGGFLFRVSQKDNVEAFHDVMILSDEGNVGIGRGAKKPNEKLVVDGTIKAKEVIITEALTADFVFADDYDLRSLKEVEAFINKNNHLPEVPSAKTMEETGIGVAQMNQLLLQKVEELTLYVIELEKKVEAIEKQ